MITWLLLTALALRLVAAGWPSFTIDTNSFIAWSQHIVQMGPRNFYATIWSDYAPGYLYVLWGVGGIHRLLSFVSYEWLIRVPAILADVATGYLIYWIVRKSGESGKLGRLGKLGGIGVFASGLYLLNPAIMFNSAIWGQVDAVSTALVVLAAAVLGGLGKLGRLGSGGGFFLLGLAVVVKPQSLIFLPAFAVWELGKLGMLGELGMLGRLGRLGVGFGAPILLLSWPFFPDNPVFGFVQHIRAAADTYAYTSVNAMNLWGVFGLWQPDTTHFLGLTLQIWGLLLFGIAYAALLVRGVGEVGERGRFFLLLALVAVSFFVLPTRIHERYLHPFFALFPLALFLTAPRAKVHKVLGGGIYLGVSMLHFFNLYYVYTLYTANALKIGAVHDFLNTHFSLLSATMLVWYSVLVLYAKREKFWHFQSAS